MWAKLLVLAAVAAVGTTGERTTGEEAVVTAPPTRPMIALRMQYPSRKAVVVQRGNVISIR